MRTVLSAGDAMIQAFARAVEQAGGKALLVGGIVRDELLGLPSKDYDFEIFGLPIEKVKQVLKQFGNVKEVGQHFGVLHIQELDWDVALPRRERKSGEGHKGFDVVPDPTMTVEEAARRRDLTINALSKDPLTGQIIDPLGGVEDLRNGILKAADPSTFGEDPLRALRVAQFAARFDFDVDPDTLEIVAAQPLEELPGERIFTEFQKMLLKGRKPSKGIEVLRQANLLRYFPEIEALQGVPQDPEHHPEGDVYIHTLMVIDEAARQRTGTPAFDLPLMFGALAHDFGKPEFTQVDEETGRVKAYGHEEGGEAPTRAFLNRMRAPKALISQVATLVSTHLRPQLMAERAKAGGYRRLGRKLAANDVSFDLLAAVSKADTLGRTTEKAMRRDTSLQDKFLEEADKFVLKAAPPGQSPLEDTVKGKDLIERGMKPGPDMGKFLKITRHIEDETGLKDADKLIELATKFLEQIDDLESGEEAGPGDLDCGDSHIRPGETCYDGKYDEMRKKGRTDSSQGPDEFRTHPDASQPDWILWNEYHWPHKDPNVTQHPGLATAEPAREHKRSLEYQPRWFDSGTKWSERSRMGPKSRDGFEGRMPYSRDPGFPPVGPPQDEEHWTSVTPEPGLSQSGQPAEFPTMHPPGDKGPGFFDWDKLPSPQLLETNEPHPSPMRASDQPGQFVRHPGGGGLDRAPMIRPQGKPKPGGFLPVVTPPDPSRNMFRASSRRLLDSNFDQHELELGIEKELEHAPDDKAAKERAKERLSQDPQYYSRKSKKGVDPEVPNKEKNQVIVDPAESIESKLGGPQYINRTTKDFDHSREDFDYDYTGKKPGYLSMPLPKEELPTKSARTMEDYMDIETIFPKDYNPDWEDGGPTIGPSRKHRNKRHVPKNPIQADDVMQKQVQPLIPNLKLAIAVDPRGEPGDRITVLSPLFDDVSPAIQALRSQRFENHSAVVVDGPPMWLAGLEPILETMDRSNTHETPEELIRDILDLASTKGLTIDYTQKV